MTDWLKKALTNNHKNHIKKKTKNPTSPSKKEDNQSPIYIPDKVAQVML